MDFKTGLLVLTFLAGCFAAPTFEVPEDDMSIFFNHTVTDSSSRIVGGTQAAAGSHPHMVALTTGVMFRSLICGGSLITQRTILTAAHCIYAFGGNSLPSSVRATVGTNRWNSGGTTYSIARAVAHANYMPDIHKNDIGILITSSNVVLNNLVRTVPITYSHIPGGVRSRVAGWGAIKTGGAGSATLLELFPTTLAGNDCEARMARAAIIFDAPRAHVQSHIEICTFQAANFGICNGDSGSALLRADNGQQFGIVSWGFSCALGVPDVFVRISAYQNWLRANVV